MNELYNFYNNLYNEKWDQLYQVIVNNELKDEEYQLSEQDKSHLEQSLGEFKLLQKHSIHTPNAIAKAFSSGVAIDSFSLNDKEDIHLQDVECHNDMKLWIEKHKAVQEHNLLNIFRDKMDADKLPMSLWSKMDVISFITKLEDIQPHFESALWQYNINGQDLCDITEEQMEWLMQISIENNHDIDLEDNFISDSKDDEDEFGVKALKSEVNKNRIKSHIVCYYYHTMDRLKSLCAENNIQAQSIYNIIKMLRMSIREGPKAFWKSDAIFFHKIDNFLAVLLANTHLQEMYLKCYKVFEVDKHDENESNSIITKEHMLEISSNSFEEQENNVEMVKEDLMDTCADKICCYHVSECIHNTDRFFCKVICWFLFGCVFAASLVNIWYYYNTIDIIHNAMDRSMDIIGIRTKNQMTIEFQIPQLIMKQTVSDIRYSKIFNHNNIIDTDNTYDAWLTSFATFDNAAHISAVFLYNNNTNHMIGAYTEENRIIISEFNGTCLIDLIFDQTTQQRDVEKVVGLYCTYNPRKRPWFQLAVKAGVDKSVWTDPYQFHNGKYGSSLVASIIKDETLLIVLTEITINSLSSRVDVLNDDDYTFNNLPDGAVLMLAMHNLDVVLSSEQNQIDIQSNENCNECHSKNKLIKTTMEYVRSDAFNVQQMDFNDKIVGHLFDTQNHYYLSIFPFKMMYLDFFSTSPNIAILNDTESQYGFIIISNDDSFLSMIYIVWSVNWLILAFMVSIGVGIVCFQIRYSVLEDIEATSRFELINRTKRSLKEPVLMMYGYSRTHNANMDLNSHSRFLNMVQDEKEEITELCVSNVEEETKFETDANTTAADWSVLCQYQQSAWLMPVTRRRLGPMSESKIINLYYNNQIHKDSLLYHKKITKKWIKLTNVPYIYDQIENTLSDPEQVDIKSQFSNGNIVTMNRNNSNNSGFVTIEQDEDSADVSLKLMDVYENDIESNCEIETTNVNNNNNNTGLVLIEQDDDEYENNLES
eukprot:350168_1